MKTRLLAIAALLSLSFTSISFAQTVSLAKADRLLNFVQAAQPALFSPPTQTQQVNTLDSDWFFRDFSGSGALLAININGYGPFYSGDVYALGPAFGDGPVFIDSLTNLLAYIDSLSAAVTLAEADALFDFAESVEAGLFSPASQTRLTNTAGSSWYERFYAISGITLKINLDGAGVFNAGGIYVVGGDFGTEDVFVGGLDDLLTLIEGESSEDSRSAITKAKDFVSDLRDLTASARINAFENELEAFGNAVTLAFDDQVDLVSGVVTNDLGKMIGAFIPALDALTSALDALQLNPGLTSFVSDYGDGLLVTVAITNNGDGPVLSVNQNILDVAVALTANGSAEFSETDEGQSTVSEINLAFSLNGTAVNDEFSFSIEEGSQVFASILETYSQNESAIDFEETDSVSASSIDVDLAVSVTALQAADSTTFDGQFGFNITDLQVDSSWTQQQSETQSVTTESDLIGIGNLEINLAGSFSDNSGNQVGAALTLTVENTGGQTIRFEKFKTSTIIFNPYSFSSIAETSSNETAASFLAVTILFQVQVALPGIDNSSLLTFDIHRTGLEDAAALVTLDFNGKFLVFDVNSETLTATLSNQDNVTALLSENPVSGLLEGTLNVGELAIAVIEELPNGILIVRYIDDTFESLAL